MGAQRVNARWVRERRIERVGRTATLHTELGLVAAARRRRARRRARARGAQGPPARRRRRGPDRGRARRPLRRRSDARLGPAWEDGRAVASRSGRRRRATSRCCCASERVAMERGDDGVWRVTRRRVVARRRVRVRGHRVRARASTRRHERRHRSVLARADAQLARSVLAELAPPERLAEAAAAARLRRRDLRAAHPRLLDRRRDRPGRAPRHLPRVHARRQRRDAPPARARRGRDDAPCTCCRATTSRRSRRTARKHLDPGPARRTSPPDSRGAAAPRSARSATATASTGATTRCTITTPEGSYAVDPAHRTSEFRAMVARAQRDRPARRARRRLQPHARRRPAPALDPRPDRPRLLPPARRPTGALETSTCCANTASEHRMMEKLMLDSLRDLGARVPRRRLPLRPDGPPHEGEPARGARAARPGAAPLRRGLELRRGRRRRAVRRGVAEATWPAPGSARSTTACATPSAAAARTTTTRATRASPPASPTRRARRSRTPRSRSSSASPGGLRARPRTRSPTSTRTTTRRCSTRSR